MSSVVTYSIVRDGLSTVTPSTPGSPLNSEVKVPFLTFCQKTKFDFGDAMTLQPRVTVPPYSTVLLNGSTVTIGMPI